MKQQKNNLDEIDKMLYEYFENNKEIPEETAKVIENTFHKKKKSHLMIFRAVATVCTVFLLTTGVVFAKDIAKANNNRAIILETQTCNVNAIDFYHSQGFLFDGIETTCYNNDDIKRKEVRLELVYFIK